ncbi:MAG: glycosyl hydrolase 115 family protein, partial [Flavobacterium sp.]|nr:glycosyl hydrolase 115 family protein [Flavobacterium sp.]
MIPTKIKAEDLQKYTEWWASQQFGNQYAKEIAEMLTKYTKYNSRRKPELLSSDTYSILHYKEAETVVEEYNSLA